jgi:hypothetical protein
MAEQVNDILVAVSKGFMDPLEHISMEAARLKDAAQAVSEAHGHITTGSLNAENMFRNLEIERS